jgi:glycerophosphoryl diester phosphodiesterase
MQYYAHYDDKTGKIIGFYADGIHGENIPDPKISISEAEWRDAVANQDKRKVSRETLKIVETLPPMPSREECLSGIRYRRNQLLSETDWTQLADIAMTDQQKADWRNYRQALRDFPAGCNPYSPEWPERPTV